MAMLPAAPSVAAATFKVLEGTGAGAPAFEVQFNPESLDYTISNQFDDRNGNNGARQFVKKSSAKLAMTLVFDSTDDGSDIRAKTERISRLLEPAKSGAKKFAPKVEFGWGTYSFKGVVEQYKETIDFFAASGVPLRASVSLTLASQEVEFQSSKNPSASVDGGAGLDAVSAPRGIGPSDLAIALGDPRAARGIASLNASASLRFGADASLSVGGGISLAAPAAFSAGGGLGIGGSVGVGIGGGIGVGVGGGIGVGIGGGIGVGISGGIGATAGAAFTGLRVGVGATAGVSTADAQAALLPAAALGGGASFGPGGRARVLGGASLSADVGAGADLNVRLGFGD